MISINNMVEQLEGLLGKKDLTDWETKFVKNITGLYKERGKQTTQFSSKQLETIERIWEKHFAG